MTNLKLTLYGFISILIGVFTYSIGFIVAIPRRIFFDNPTSFKINQIFVWYSGIPLMIGIVLILIDLFIFLPRRKKEHYLKYRKINNKKVTVVLTAYNDELSIGRAVRDFKTHPLVKRIIVISNNSKDRTIEVAKKAGAITHNEEHQGYGFCVHRALTEGVKYKDTELTLLCEGDMTFRAHDIDKFLAYIPHVDIVNGTRIVEQLREKETQISTFIYYGNFFVGKLLELKHIGKTTLSDVGTTYKLCRNDSLKKLLPHLDPRINLEFNPYLLDTALEMDLKIVECPISFYRRVGESKGGNVNNVIALKLGMRMIYGIILGWKGLIEK